MPQGVPSRETKAAAGEELEDVGARFQKLALEGVAAAHDGADPLLGCCGNMHRRKPARAKAARELCCVAFGMRARAAGPLGDERGGDHLVVALGPDGEVLLGECKWGSIEREDVKTLERRRGLILKELQGVTRVYLAIFAGNPVSDLGLQARIDAGEVLHFTLDDLF